MPAVRPSKPVQRPSGISRRTQKTQNLEMSDGLPPEQASLFAPSAIPAVGVPEEKVRVEVRQPSARVPSARLSRGESETIASDSTANSSSRPSASSSVEEGSVRQGQRPIERPPETPPVEPQRSPVILESSLDEEPSVANKEKPNNEIFKRLMEIFDLVRLII